MPATTIRPRRRGRRLVVAVVVFALVVAALVIDAAVVGNRFKRHDVAMPETPGPRTWVILGLDDRSAAGGQVIEYTGPPESQPGTRADVIIVVTQSNGRLQAMSVPRGLMVGTPVREDPGSRNRLGVFWTRSPQEFTDLVCTDLGIPVDHLVTIDLQAFVEIIDSLGGITLDVPYPLRDSELRFDLPAGPVEMDGITALNYVRSRLGEAYLDGQWVPEPEGEQARRERQAQMIQAVLTAAKRRPLAWQRLAWRASPHVGLDTHTGWLDLAPLLRLGEIETLPTDPIGDGPANAFNDQSRQFINSRGYGDGCEIG